MPRETGRGFAQGRDDVDRRRRRSEGAATDVEGQGGSKEDEEIAAGDEPQASASDADVSSDAGEDTPKGVSAGDPPA